MTECVVQRITKITIGDQTIIIMTEDEPALISELQNKQPEFTPLKFKEIKEVKP
jgi:hypothetical protein